MPRRPRSNPRRRAPLSIIAWFKDRDAVTAWYMNGIHQIYVGRLPRPSGWPMPLADVPKDTLIMVIATFGFGGTPSTPDATPSANSPSSSTPVPGGAPMERPPRPDAFEIPGMRDHTAR
ncbi:MAG: hypothetical protein H6809_07995 [Phycisphaeraceae bacterium]|nr:hypothetical protein [Phycisphaeraceae bacterium]